MITIDNFCNNELIIYITVVILIAVIIIVRVIRFLLSYKNYKSSNYYLATKNSYWDVHNYDGLYGEYILYLYLQSFENLGCKFLFNLYVPRENGKTTEIDMVMFHRKGLFVIESKNYSGWIFGNEKHKYWTQTLYSGYGACHKECFYNPIMQNLTHIRAVRRHIDDTIPLYSVIAFSDKCTLKDVTVNSNVILDYYSCLYEAIELRISEINNYTMTLELLDETYSILAQYANADEITKFEHINNIE